jgi:hypothetical protein
MQTRPAVLTACILGAAAALLLAYCLVRLADETLPTLLFLLRG